MTYWSFWLGGFALTTVTTGHWLITRRMMAVSGRYTSLLDHFRIRSREVEDDLSPDELAAALLKVTAAEFGEDAVNVANGIDGDDLIGKLRPKQGPWMHLLFFVGLALGGLLSKLLAGSLTVSGTLDGAMFACVFGGTPWIGPFVLTAGGILIRFGTRMAAGCTSGHGLCGVSRFQLGSFASTASFFGSGVVVSLLIRAMCP